MMMMTNIQRLHANSIQNGQLVNADDLNAEYNQLINKANELDDAVYLNKTFTGNKVFNGTTTFQQDVTLNAGLTLENTPVTQAKLLHWGGDESGTLANTLVIHPDYAPTPIPDGTVYAFKIAGAPGTLEALQLQVGANAPLPVLQSAGQPLRGKEAGAASTLVVMKTDEGFLCLNAPGLPLGTIVAPIPQYVDASTVQVSGWLNARAGSIFNALDFYSTQAISTLTTGLNGLESGTVAPNTWYYIKAVQTVDASSSGYILSTSTDSADVTINAETYICRRLPIALKTNANGDIIPFVVVGGWPTQPKILFTTVRRGSMMGLPSVSGNPEDTRVLIAGTATLTTPVSCAAFVPPISRVAHLNILGGGSVGDAYFLNAHESSDARGYALWNDSSKEALSHDLTLLLDGDRNFRYRCTGQPWYASVLGYTVTEI